MTPPVYGVVIGVALGGLMLGVAISDWRYFRVPDRLTALALALRIVDLMMAPEGSRLEALAEASLRAAAMAALFYLFSFVYRRWRGCNGLGLGDIKLAAVAGAWIDWPLLAPVVEAAAIFGLGVALYRAARAREPIRASTRLPFAVGFSAAIFLGWQVQRFYS